MESHIRGNLHPADGMKSATTSDDSGQPSRKEEKGRDVSLILMDKNENV